MLKMKDKTKELKHGGFLRIISILLLIYGVFTFISFVLILTVETGVLGSNNSVEVVLTQYEDTKAVLYAIMVIGFLDSILNIVCGVFGIRVSRGRGRAHTCQILAIILLGASVLELFAQSVMSNFENTGLLEIILSLALPILYSMAARSEVNSKFWQHVEAARQASFDTAEEEVVSIRSCHVEAAEDGVFGTLAIPQHKFPNWVGKSLEEETKEYATARFTLSEDRLEIDSDDTQFLALYEEYRQSRLREKLVAKNSFTAGTDLYGLLRYIMRNDAELLVGWRDSLAALEELSSRSTSDVPKDFDLRISNSRNALNTLTRFYKQLKNVCESISYAAESDLGKADRKRFKRLADRADQLAAEAGECADYAMQVSSMFQTRVNSRQTEITTVLTVVATICMSVSLITGWFGMNLDSMPERFASTTYIWVIFASIAVVTIELVYFKRKKWF